MEAGWQEELVMVGGESLTAGVLGARLVAAAGMAGSAAAEGRSVAGRAPPETGTIAAVVVAAAAETIVAVT